MVLFQGVGILELKIACDLEKLVRIFTLPTPAECEDPYLADST